MIRTLLVLMTLGPIAPASAQLDVGDLAWSRRAGDFALTGRVSAEAVDRALDAYEGALEETPDSFDLRFKVMEALYFKGYFSVEGRGDKKRLFDRLAELAEETVDLARSEEGPELVRAHFWAAIAWGLWGMSHSYLASGTKGVAGKIRTHAQAVIVLDERFADAGGLRLLGRLHTATPRVPLFTGWVDRAMGISLLDRAQSVSDRDPRNALFLAEALLQHQPENRGRALDLLREVSARSADPAYLVEQTETLEEARRLLAEVEGES